MAMRYRYRTTDRDELDAFLKLVGSDSTMVSRSVVQFGARLWRLGDLIVAADCISRDKVRFLL